MKITNSSLFFYCLCIPICGFSQYISSGDLSLKVYANIMVEQQENETLNLVKDDTLGSSGRVSVFQFGQFTPALAIYHANNHFSEIEIATLQVKRQDNVRVGTFASPFPGTTSALALSLRYGYHFSLMGSHTNVVQPYMGLSVAPFLEINRSTPENKVLYDSKETRVGVLGQVTPRLIFSLTNYLTLDFNVLITAVEFTNRSLKLESSAISTENPNEQESQLRWLPNRTQIRLGVGVLF